jgi:cytochrome c-type biogenesis protein
MNYALQVGIGVAFVAGLASFLSPCVLPLVPIYLAQLVAPGIEQTENRPKTTRIKAFLHAATFVAGFTLSFVALGATASTLGSFLLEQRVLLRQVGGILLVVIGLHLAGILTLPFLYWQKRFTYQPTQSSYPASFLIGVVFAIAWSPCVGPVLGAILGMAAYAATLQQGVLLLLAYSLGLGIPFLLLGLGLDRLSLFLKSLKPHLRKIEIATGIMLTIVGILIFFNLFSQVNAFFNFNLG